MLSWWKGTKTKWLFLVTGIIFALAIIPVIWMIKTEKRIKKVEQNDEVKSEE